MPIAISSSGTQALQSGERKPKQVLQVVSISMKNRRSFIKAASSIVMSSTLISLPEFSLANNLNKKGIVKNAGEGDTYLVRENTPITIKASKSADEINGRGIRSSE